jgi:hypothetical protein
MLSLRVAVGMDAFCLDWLILWPVDLLCRFGGRRSAWASIEGGGRLRLL